MIGIDRVPLLGEEFVSNVGPEFSRLGSVMTTDPGGWEVIHDIMHDMNRMAYLLQIVGTLDTSRGSPRILNCRHQQHD